MLHWMTEVAEQAAAFSRHCLHDVPSTQVQMDELFAVLSAVKAGEVREEALPLRGRVFKPQGASQEFLSVCYRGRHVATAQERSGRTGAGAD